MIDCAVSDYTAIVDSPCGMLGILDNNEYLLAINFLYDSVTERSTQTRLAAQVVKQLKHFFTDASFRFHLPLGPPATPYQARARQALLEIPVGQTMSYANVAKIIASSPRAIAGACRRNPLPIIVPCHRVVATKGLGGFSGALHGRPLETKRWLLEHECASR